MTLLTPQQKSSATSFAMASCEIPSYPSSRCHLSCLPSLLGSLVETVLTSTCRAPGATVPCSPHQPESAGRLLSAVCPIGSEEPAHKAIMISLDENTTPAPGRISRGTVPTFLSRTAPCRGHELGVHPFGRSLAGGHIVCRAFCRLRHSVSLGTRHRKPSSVSNLTRADEHEPSKHPPAGK